MSEHEVTVRWQLEREPFEAGRFNLEHAVTFGGGASLRASGAPAFGGLAACPNPEEALVWALSSCHMLTFLTISAKRRFVVERYADRAVGYLEPNQDGKLAITRVVLRPEVGFRGAAPAPGTLERMHASSHRECFIARSVRAQVIVASG